MRENTLHYIARTHLLYMILDLCISMPFFITVYISMLKR